MKNSLFVLLVLMNFITYAQELKLKARNPKSLNGSDFTNSIIDSSLSINQREEMIFNEIKKGNVPNFFRKLQLIKVEKKIQGKNYQLEIYVSPDYFAIGNNENYFYVPTTPSLAQRIANLTSTMLPTKIMVDEIYMQSKIKLTPQPIPPSKEMSTVPVFIAHHTMILSQLEAYQQQHLQATLTAGHKKDIIISNKIHGEATPRVVIYGWHKLDGKAIQPPYNRHTNTWVDYSHGIRLISNTAYLNGKKTNLSQLLKHPILHQLISDEGVISNPKYPIN